VQELPPGWSVPARRGVDACGAQDLVDGRWRDGQSQLGQLAVNTPVTPERVLVRQADGELGDAPDRRRRPGLRRLLVSYFRAASLRCQASSVAGVTGKTSAQRLRGMNRVSAANQARSPGSYRTRPAFRRSTAFWCRSASNSAFLSPSPRTTRTARLNNQRISKQAILSSTRPANHHHASLAGERAGQRHDRVSGRHRVPPGRCACWSVRLAPGSGTGPLHQQQRGVVTQAAGLMVEHGPHQAP
jgi:hypothetical protein